MLGGAIALIVCLRSFPASFWAFFFSLDFGSKYVGFTPPWFGLLYPSKAAVSPRLHLTSWLGYNRDDNTIG